MPNIQEALDLQMQGKFGEAEQIYLRFLKESPKQPDVSNLLGLIYLQTQKLNKAQEYFEYAVEGFPCAEYYQNLGLIYYKKKSFPKAMECFEKAIAFESKNAEFIKNFAKMAKTANQTDFAIKFLKQYLSLVPQDSAGWNNLGLLYDYEHKYDLTSAKDCYTKSLKIKQNYEALHNLGILYRMERNFDKSIKCLQKALRLNPNSNKTNLAIGMSYLSKKDFQNGYKHYMTKKPQIAALYQNHWEGTTHKDKTLLVYYDSGFGDQIMFCRYLNLVKEKFAKVKLFTLPHLKKLFEINFPDIEIKLFNDNKYDFSDNIMYLNYHLGLDFEHIPFSHGYLNAEKSHNPIFCTKNQKIGLCWQGNYDGYTNRAISLSQLSSLLDLPECTFYSFVKEDKEKQIKEFPQIIDVGTTLQDFYDTASKLLNLDLFITIDTAVANLAGALGVKTYLLLPYASEWRWFSDTKTTPWYDSVTIFKQKEPNNWTNVIEEIKEQLKNSY